MKGELRKMQILKTSEKIFSQKGYYETYVEDIIKELKIGKGTFYRYFKSKEELFSSLLKKILIDWEREVFIDPSELNISNINTLFKDVIKKSLRFFEQNEDLCNIYVRISPGLNQIFDKYIQRFEAQMLDYITIYLKAGEQLGIVKKDLDIDLAANIMAGAYLRVGYFYFVLNKNRYASVDIDKMGDDFYKIIMNGVLVDSDV